MNDCLYIQIPNADCVIRPGNVVKLGRFDNTRWVVGYGWYSWGGNRPVCGWYLAEMTDKCHKHDKIAKEVKPLQLPDLDDIYVIET